MNRLTAVVVLSVMLLGLATPAQGGGTRRRPPRVNLRTRGERIQHASLGSYCWSYTNPDGTGVGECADAVPSFPKPVPAGAGVFRFRVRFSTRPKSASVAFYRSLDDNGYPQGDAHKIPHHLKPFNRQGERPGWDVVFRLKHKRNYYLDLFLRYEGDADYSAAVKVN